MHKLLLYVCCIPSTAQFQLWEMQFNSFVIDTQNNPIIKDYKASNYAFSHIKEWSDLKQSD